MRRYEQDWATHEIARTVAKNKRGYQRKTGCFTAFHHSQADENDIEGQDADEQDSEEEEDGDEGQAEGTRKRTKDKQGGTKGKRLRA